MLIGFSQNSRLHPQILFLPQPKDIQFIIIEKKRTKKAFTFKKLESD